MSLLNSKIDNRKPKFLFAALLFVLVLLISIFNLAITPVAAQEGGPTPSPDEVNAIAKNLYCPVCENVPLDVCGTAACAQWRQQIAGLLIQGYTEQQVYDYFAEQYGAGVLAAPPASGLNWLVYLLPPTALLLGAVLLWRGFSSWKAKRPAQKMGLKSSDRYVQQLEDELKARR